MAVDLNKPSKETSSRSVLISAFSLILAITFLGMGFAKLTGIEFLYHPFHAWSPGASLLVVIGVLEIAGSLLVLIPASRFWGASLLGALMVFAALFQLDRGDVAYFALSLGYLALAATIAWFRRPVHRGDRPAVQGGHGTTG